MLFIGSQLAAVRLWGIQRRKSELVFAKGRTQNGGPGLRVDAKFGVDVPVQEHHPPPQRKDVGGGHSGVGDALAVLQVVIADVRDGNGGAHIAQIFGVEQLILRKQFLAEMEAVLPQEVTAVEFVAGAAIVEGVRLLDQMLCVLLSGVHPGRQIAVGPGAGRIALEHMLQRLFPWADVLHIVFRIHHPEGRDHKIGGVGLGGGDQLFRKIGQFSRMIWENIGFLWKVILVMLVLAFFEGIGVLMFFNSDIALLLWLLEKLVLYPLVLWYCVQLNQLKNGTEKIAGGEPGYQISTKRMTGIFKEQGEQINHISDGMTHAIEERMKSERFKTELITNVSHDLKTPLTAITTYIELLKKEDITEEERRSYIDTLERKSLRLKVLIEDLFEVSKANSNNIVLNKMELDVVNLIKQVSIEHVDKMKERGLELKWNVPEEKVLLMLDNQKTYRIFENLFVNVVKYAMQGSRVYLEVRKKASLVEIILKNMSAEEIHISGDEITERFVRGDSSRNTEGSGLGLAIAKSFTEAQGGEFHVEVDGDLFKVVILF